MLVGSLALGACGYSETKFVEEYQDAYCSLLAECGYVDDVAACLSASEDPRPEDGCEYEKHTAKQCVAEWQEAACDAAYPTVCDQVYVECS